jgi:hypothetical protein
LAERSIPTYRQLLEEALEIGRLDGRFAADFEPTCTAADGSGRCLGRTPAEFAGLLWEHRPGSPPAGLEVNAPSWYAVGFRDGLATRRAELRGRHRSGAHPPGVHVTARFPGLCSAWCLPNDTSSCVRTASGSRRLSETESAATVADLSRGSFQPCPR